MTKRKDHIKMKRLQIQVKHLLMNLFYRVSNYKPHKEIGFTAPIYTSVMLA